MRSESRSPAVRDTEFRGHSRASSFGQAKFMVDLPGIEQIWFLNAVVLYLYICLISSSTKESEIPAQVTLPLKPKVQDYAAGKEKCCCIIQWRRLNGEMFFYGLEDVVEKLVFGGCC
ncbi:unnamed protein product [Ilex paraguariensis]|uniref:Uncharacterized protein n=1 Tax=Ilex paraguariensis TaxID=185542 RepID=A0ABC8S4I9_9AQUA